MRFGVKDGLEPPWQDRAKPSLSCSELTQSSSSKTLAPAKQVLILTSVKKAWKRGLFPFISGGGKKKKKGAAAFRPCPQRLSPATSAPHSSGVLSSSSNVENKKISSFFLPPRGRAFASRKKANKQIKKRDGLKFALGDN